MHPEQRDSTPSVVIRREFRLSLVLVAVALTAVMLLGVGMVASFSTSGSGSPAASNALVDGWWRAMMADAASRRDEHLSRVTDGWASGANDGTRNVPSRAGPYRRPVARG